MPVEARRKVNKMQMDAAVKSKPESNRKTLTLKQKAKGEEYGQEKSVKRGWGQRSHIKG